MPFTPRNVYFFTKNIMMFCRLVFMLGLLKNFKTDYSFKIRFLKLFRFMLPKMSAFAYADLYLCRVYHWVLCCVICKYMVSHQYLEKE